MDNENKNGEYYTPYDEASQVNNPLMERKSTTSMVLGIIAIVCSFTGMLAPIGLVLGIIAVVKSNKFRKENSSAKAGYILGIIAIIGAAVMILGFLLMMSHGSSMFIHGQSIGFRSGMHGSYFYQNGPRFFHSSF